MEELEKEFIRDCKQYIKPALFINADTLEEKSGEQLLFEWFKEKLKEKQKEINSLKKVNRTYEDTLQFLRDVTYAYRSLC